MEDGKVINNHYEIAVSGGTMVMGNDTRINLDTIKEVMLAIANYTPTVEYPEKLINSMIKAYIDKPNKNTIAKFAKEMGKTKESIVNKLKTAGVYNYHKQYEKNKKTKMSDIPVLTPTNKFEE